MGTVSFVEIGLVLFAVYGLWYANRYYQAVLGDRRWVRESGKNGVRLALVNRDIRSSRERALKIFLCLVVGIVGFFLPGPVTTYGSVLVYTSAAAFILIVATLVYGTRRDVVDRENIIKKILSAQNISELQ